jgi:hypothetical protein
VTLPRKVVPYAITCRVHGTIANYRKEEMIELDGVFIPEEVERRIRRWTTGEQSSRTV